MNRALVITGFCGIAAMAARRPMSAVQSPTFRADVLSVEIDARVTDKQHQFVRDLTRGDFQVFDDGRPQTISAFAIIEIPHTPAVSRPANEPDASAAAGGVDEGRVYAILIDAVHIDPSHIRETQAAASRFIEKYLASNDLATIACIGMATSQEMTANRDLLKADVDRCTAPGNASLGSGNTDNHDQAVHAAVLTMRTVAETVAGLTRRSGHRKAVVFFSQGIDLDDSNLQKYPDALESIEATQAAAAMATRGNVTIYAVDPRGATQADNTIEMGSLPRQPQAAMAMTSERRTALQRAQDNLRALADQTGGFATVNQHDLSKAFSRIVAENTSYCSGLWPHRNGATGNRTESKSE